MVILRILETLALLVFLTHSARLLGFVLHAAKTSIVLVSDPLSIVLSYHGTHHLR